MNKLSKKIVSNGNKINEDNSSASKRKRPTTSINDNKKENDRQAQAHQKQQSSSTSLTSLSLKKKSRRKEKLDDSTTTSASTASSNNTSKDKEEGEESSSSSASDNDESSGQSEGELEDKNDRNSGAEEGELDTGDEEEKSDGSGLATDAKKKDDILRTKLVKQIEKLKRDYNGVKHKLDKVDRAMSRAIDDNNKQKIKIFEKFQFKYGTKLDEKKAKIKSLRNKLNTLDEKSAKPENENEINNSKHKRSRTPEVQQSQISKKFKQNDDTTPKTQEGSTTTAKPGIIKLPYPVLNDKRDMNTILSTLETKKMELMKKREANRKILANTLNMVRKNVATIQQKGSLEKLKQMDQLIESQQEKLKRQIDYIKLSLNLEALRANMSMAIQMNQPGPSINNMQMQINQMSNQLNDMFQFMKSENKAYLIKHQPSGTDKSQQILPAPLTVEETIENEKEMAFKKLRSTFDSVNNALAALLAHTAATAHTTASVALYNYAYSYYYQQQKKSEDTSLPPLPPPVPLKEELEKASSSFAKLKDKISSFFMTSQKLSEKQELKSSKNAEATGLKKLMVDYSDEESDKEDGEEKKIDEKANDEMRIISLIKNLKKVNSKEATHSQHDENVPITISDNENDNGQDEDESDESDIEIVTTSEMKDQNEKRNYLLPSIKSSYFPLKASLEQPQILLLGAGKELTTTSASKMSLKKNSLSSILYGH